LERVVTQCWAEVLQHSEIDPGDNFFEVGGTSLLAVKLYHLLQQRLNADVPILALFRYPSVRGFVETLLGASDATRAPAAPTRPMARAAAAAPIALTPAERAARQRDAFASRRPSSGA
jgi:hypothetical protein